MLEFLTVVVCVLTFVSIGSLVLNFILVRRMNVLEEEVKKAAVLKRLKFLTKVVKSVIMKRLRRLDITVKKANTVSAETNKELADGQFKLAELSNKSMQTQMEFFGKSSKAIIDSQFDVVQKNADDILKLTTDNSQKVYDALVILIQMMNRLMSMMGYTPTAPALESGLEEPKRGQNYGQPPAQEDQEGLTFSKR